MKIVFAIYGEPAPKGRPKSVVRNGCVIVYTPKKTKDNEKFLRLSSIRYAPKKPFTGAVALTARFYRSIPKSFSKKNRVLADNGVLRPTPRPDLDNYLKQLEDSMNGVFVRDDSQVVGSHEQKFYSATPRIEIEIEELSERGSEK